MNLTDEELQQLEDIKKLWADYSWNKKAERETPPPPPRCECGAAALGYKKPGKFHSSAMPCPLYHE